MAEYQLHFSSSSSTDAGTFKLFELSSELSALVEAAVNDHAPLSLKIKGQQGEDAVLCTPDKTYAMRSVVLSNTVLVVSSESNKLVDDGAKVVIRDQCSEILELTPSVPKLHKLHTLLRGKEFDEGREDLDNGEKGYTYEEARSEIQASDAELDRMLRGRHILNIDGQLRPLAPGYLSTLLELVLNLLVSHSLPHQSASVEELSSALADEHEVSRVVSTQVMSWFGEIKEGRWKMDVEAVLKQVGLGILRHYKDEPIPQEEFIANWKRTVGDTFESSTKMELLSGNYIVSTTPTGGNTLTYFPASSLPADPATRFADIFLTRPRWKGEDIAPYLADIAVNSKERDRLLLKYARATTDSQGVWYTARVQYNA